MSSQSRTETRYPEPIPLGVCDDCGETGAVSNGDHEIDLLDLRCGAQLGRLAALDRPLMIDGGLLIACRFDLVLPGIILHRIALPSGGSAPNASLALPTPASREGHNPADLHFKVRFVRLGAEYRLYWQARILYCRGAPPPPHLDQGLGAEPTAGHFDIAADSFDLRERRGEDGFAAERADAREGEDLTRRAGGIVYRQEGELRNAPWTTPAGKLYLRAEGPPAGHRQTLAIAHADAPNSPPAALFEAEDPAMLVPELSLDGRHIAVVANDERRGGRIWRFHDAEDGRQVGSIEYCEGLRSFRVTGNRLLCLDENRSPNNGNFMSCIERALRAFDLSTGAASWSYSLKPREEPSGDILPQ